MTVQHVRMHNGYVQVQRGDGWEFEHRVVVEKYIKQELPFGYVVHHIDENRSNNALENLALMKEATHKSLHANLERGNVTTVEAYLADARALMDKLREDVLRKNQAARAATALRTRLRRRK